MPDIRNCKRCGRMFTHTGGPPICQACRSEDDENFKKVKEYLYDNPGATLSQVSTALDIGIDRIKLYLKDGRLEIVNDDGNLILECECCGKSIKTGRLCEECSRSLSKDFLSTAKQINQDIAEKQTKTQNKAIGMRYLNKNQK